VIYLDAIMIKVRDGAHVTNKACLVSSLLRHLSVMTSETFECHDF